MKANPGSVWNTNSWHWEEKNYTNWAKEALKDIIQGYKFRAGENSVEFGELMKVEGEATINIRKGKKIFIYTFSLVIFYKITPDDKSKEFTHGGIVIEEFNQDDSEIDYDVRTTLNTDIAFEGVKIVKQFVKPEILKLITMFKDRFLAVESLNESKKENKKEVEKDITGEVKKVLMETFLNKKIQIGENEIEIDNVEKIEGKAIFLKGNPSLQFSLELIWKLYNKSKQLLNQGIISVLQFNQLTQSFPISVNFKSLTEDEGKIKMLLMNEVNLGLKKFLEKVKNSSFN